MMVRVARFPCRAMLVLMVVLLILQVYWCTCSTAQCNILILCSDVASAPSLSQCTAALRTPVPPVPGSSIYPRKLDLARAESRPTAAAS